MILLDTAISVETHPLPTELLIDVPSPEITRPIAKAINLSIEQVGGAFSRLIGALNNETADEMRQAEQISPTASLTPEARRGAVARRATKHDKPALDFLLQSLLFFAGNDQSPNSRLPPPQDLHHWLDWLRLHNSIHPLAPTSTLLARLSWYLGGLNHQWLFSNKPASLMHQEAVTRFKDMSHSIFSHKDTIRAEANRLYTDQKYVVEMLKNTLQLLQQRDGYDSESLLPTNPRVLIIGPGTGKVEKDILAQLNLPREMIDAIDLLSTKDIGPVWDGMNFIGGTDLLQYAQDPTNHNKYNLVLCIGSTLVNDEDYLRHLTNALAVQTILKDGGAYIYETRLLEADLEHNVAHHRSREFTQGHPLRPPGTAPSAHTLPHFDPEGFGASMQPWHLQRLIFDLVGLDSLNNPFRSPAREDLFFDNLESNEYILNTLRHPDPSTHNALAEPVWKASEGNYRIVRLLQKLPEFDTTLAQIITRLYSRALEYPARLSSHAPSPTAKATASSQPSRGVQ